METELIFSDAPNAPDEHMNKRLEWCEDNIKKLRPYEYAYLKKNKMI